MQSSGRPVIKNNKRKRECQGSQKGGASAHHDLGRLSTLPVEVLCMVIDNLDLESFRSLSITNHNAARISKIHRQYRFLAAHYPLVLRTLYATGAPHHIGILELYNALKKKCCFLCNNPAAYIYLPTCQRICPQCMIIAPEALPVPIEIAEHKYLLPRSVLLELPHFVSLSLVQDSKACDTTRGLRRSPRKARHETKYQQKDTRHGASPVLEGRRLWDHAGVSPRTRRDIRNWQQNIRYRSYLAMNTERVVFIDQAALFTRAMEVHGSHGELLAKVKETREQAWQRHWDESTPENPGDRWPQPPTINHQYDGKRLGAIERILACVAAPAFATKVSRKRLRMLL